jgi:hypothetical protein
MKIFSVVLIAVAAGSVAACGTAATVTASPAAVPAGQPGASPPPSAACLTAGHCTVEQQQQVATSEGITNPGGLNGCLVTGDCTAAEQKGIAAGTSAGDSSGQLPAPTPASSCLLGANGADVEVGIGNPTQSCAQWTTNLASNGMAWYPISQMVPLGQNGTADGETMEQACDLTDGTQELYVEDAGGQSDGDNICSTEEQNGWTPESPPGALAQQAQQQQQAQASASAQASTSAAAQAQAAQQQDDVTAVNSDGQTLAGDISKYDSDVSTAKSALATVQGEPLCSGGTSDQQTYDDAQNVYDDAQPVYDDEGQMSTDLTAMQSDWTKMVSDWGGSVPSGVSQAEATMKAAEAINPGAYGESAAIQSAATTIQTNTGSCS